VSVPPGGGPSGAVPPQPPVPPYGTPPGSPGPYPGPGGHPGAYAGPRPPAAPPRTSLTGPVTLTVVGVLLLVAAAVAGVLVARTFVGLLPTDVLHADGSPGPAAVASGTAPGTATATLDAGARYVVVLAVDDDVDVALQGQVQVTAPDGTTFAADDAPAVSLSTTMGGVHARSAVAFQAAGAGSYTIAVPATDVEGATFLVVPDEDFGPFMTGVFTTVGGTFAAVALGGLGLVVTVAGAVWWGVRVSARRRVAAGG